MAAPAHVFTIARVAQIIREDEQLLWDLAINMEPEDGCLWVYGTDEQHTMAFTDRGLDYLQELIAEHFNLTPRGIIRTLDLRRPLYKQTAAYGHFGRDDLDVPWEKTDKAETLRAAAGIAAPELALADD